MIPPPAHSATFFDAALVLIDVGRHAIQRLPPLYEAPKIWHFMMIMIMDITTWMMSFCLCTDKLQRLVERWQRCLVENKTQWRERALNGTIHDIDCRIITNLVSTLRRCSKITIMHIWIAVWNAHVCTNHVCSDAVYAAGERPFFTRIHKPRIYSFVAKSLLCMHKPHI